MISGHGSSLPAALLSLPAAHVPRSWGLPCPDSSGFAGRQELEPARSLSQRLAKRLCPCLSHHCPDPRQTCLQWAGTQWESGPENPPRQASGASAGREHPQLGTPIPNTLHWALQASWEAPWGVSLRSPFLPPMACMPGETAACSPGHLTSHNDRKSWPKWLMGSEVGGGM